MNDEEELIKACRYYWIGGFWAGSAVTASAMTVVGLIIWVAV